MISDEQAKEYQEAYRRDFGTEISLEQAKEQAKHLFALYCAVCLKSPLKDSKKFPDNKL